MKDSRKRNSSSHSKRTGQTRRPSSHTTSRSNQRTENAESHSRASSKHDVHAKKTAQKKRTAQNVSRGKTPSNSLLWTMDGKKKSKKESPLPLRVLQAIGGGIVALLGLIVKGLGSLIRLISKSKIAVSVSIVVLALVLFGAVDHAINWGKAYPGVKIGEIDVGGKSIEEVEELVSSVYAPRLEEKYVYIFASEEASENISGSLASLNNHELAEQQSVREAEENRKLWITDSQLLEVNLDSRALAQQAINTGREDGGLLTRISSLVSGHTVEPWANYEPQKLEELASKIDASIGDPRVNFGISIEEGEVSLLEGHDGYMVDRASFTGELNKAFLEETSDTGSFVAKAEYAPLQVAEPEAEKAKDLVENALSRSYSFSFEDVTWEAGRAEVGSWISTQINLRENGVYELVPFFDAAKAKGILMSHLTEFDGSVLQVSMAVDRGNVSVYAKTEEKIPVFSDAINELNAICFSEGSAELTTVVEEGSRIQVSLAGTSVPAVLSFDEALEYGIISKISEFTTEYSSYAEARNHNIHLVASKLTDSLVKANEGIWSFNGTAGECNEEAGFMAAGAIYDGEFVQEYGGGICQVATTVFNAVYDAGFPITERQSHSLYMASYPDGRDAAVSWPDLDLKWKNDSASDVVLKMNCTDTSVTAALYGVNPEYHVSTVTGDWQEGTKAKTVKKVDETLAPGTEYVKTSGTDAKSIVVTRTVKDSLGTVLHTDQFSSHYNSQDKEVLVGPSAESNTQTEASTGSETNRTTEGV